MSDAYPVNPENRALIEEKMMGLFRQKYLEMLETCPEFGLLLDAAREEGVFSGMGF